MKKLLCLVTIFLAHVAKPSSPAPQAMSFREYYRAHKAEVDAQVQPSLAERLKRKLLNDDINLIIPCARADGKKPAQPQIELTDLDGIEDIPGIENLQFLCAPYNKIRAIPKSIEKLKSLSRLSLTRNEISEVPKFLGDMANLQYVYLFGNPIPQTAEEIAYLHPRFIYMIQHRYSYYNDMHDLYDAITNGSLPAVKSFFIKWRYCPDCLGQEYWKDVIDGFPLNTPGRALWRGNNALHATIMGLANSINAIIVNPELSGEEKDKLSNEAGQRYAKIFDTLLPDNPQAMRDLLLAKNPAGLTVPEAVEAHLHPDGPIAKMLRLPIFNPLITPKATLSEKAASQEASAPDILDAIADRLEKRRFFFDAKIKRD